MMEKNNLVETSEAEPAEVGPNHESPDAATVLLPYPTSPLIQFWAIRTCDSTRNKLAHPAVSKLWESQYK